jgi:AAA domain
MADLTRVTRGKIEQAPRVLIYSFEGVGKTSWAVGAPDPFIIDINKGSSAFDVQRVFIDTWQETNEYVEAVESGQIKCKTLVLDILTDFEAAAHSHLFVGTTVTKYEGGFNKGDDVVVTEWRKLLFKLERVWQKGIGVIFTAHAKVRGFTSPLMPSYDRFTVVGREPLTGLLRGWCDYLLFATIVESVTAPEAKGKQGRATTTGERVVYTRRTPAYDAKARGTSLFPEKLPLSYESFAAAVRADGSRGDEMRKEIDIWLGELSDAALTTQVRDYLKRNPTQIADAHNRVKIRVTEKMERQEAGTSTPNTPPAAVTATAAS